MFLSPVPLIPTTGFPVLYYRVSGPVLQGFLSCTTGFPVLYYRVSGPVLQGFRSCTTGFPVLHYRVSCPVLALFSRWASWGMASLLVMLFTPVLLSPSLHAVWSEWPFIIVFDMIII